METLLIQTTNLPIELLRFIVLPMAWDYMISEEMKTKFMKHVIPQFMVYLAEWGIEVVHESVAMMQCISGSGSCSRSRSTYFRRGCLCDIYTSRSYITDKRHLAYDMFWIVCYNNHRNAVFASHLL